MIAINLAPMRVCEECGERKPLAKFDRHETKGKLFGWRKTCRACRGAASWARRGPERQRIYLSDPNVKARVRENQRAAYRRKMEDPEFRARTAQSRRLWRARNAVSVMLDSARARAAKKGLEFDLTAQDIEIPERCPVLGIKIESWLGRNFRCGARPESPALDRIDNGKGYVRGNVHVISNRANRIKGDASLDELRSLVAYMEGLVDGRTLADHGARERGPPERPPALRRA